MNTCPICDSAMHNVFSAKLLKKYEVSYRQCLDCGLLQTEEPYWLEEAYGEAIAVADTGLVMRNFSLASKLAVLLYQCFDQRGTYLDIAGGYGMLARLMRDYGFDYFWDDKYCQNLLARGFEADKSTKTFAALTAFEVLEHLHDPLVFIREKLDQYKCRTLIFTTELYEGVQPPAKDWWYYSFNTGQHISFYQQKTLERLAKRLGLNFYSLHGLHILTDKAIRITPLLRIMTGRLSLFMALFIRRRLGTLTLSDHFMLR
ncbi:MAG: class I SAM-dependent methyltransferase [Deltaproteobacteria bacterium]|nr:class I SAM-dependent methyltransferase [Deltaproteobacteria bacterium]